MTTARVPGFLPSTNAFLFRNGPSWPPALSVTIGINGLPVVIHPQMGLCGGMAFLTRDIFQAGRAQLAYRDSATIPDALAEFILLRLIESFGGPPTVARWLSDTQAFDHDVVWGTGVFHRTVDECGGIMGEINAGHLCPIGVLLTQSAFPWDVFKNHVELVWAYDYSAPILTLYTYDCNAPGRDDIFIQLDISSETPAKQITTNGTYGPTVGHIRGFFQLPYAYVDPSPAYRT